jgi:hypothetical protein
MSRTKPTEGELLMLQFECDTCGNEPGDWCCRPDPRTGLGVYCTDLHAPRYYQAVAAGLLPLPDGAA